MQRATAISISGGAMIHTLSFSTESSGGLSPNVIVTTCLKNPMKRIATKNRAATLANTWFRTPADKINAFVRNIPNGGAPVIAKSPVKNSKPVTGSVAITPRTFEIFVVLYFKNIVPADKKRADLIREW